MCVNICNELAYKLYMIRVEENARQANLSYLFEWHEIRKRGRHKERFAEFLRRKTGSVTLDIDDLEFISDTIRCNFTMLLIPERHMKRNNENINAILTIKDKNRTKCLISSCSLRMSKIVCTYISITIMHIKGIQIK